MRKFCLLPLLTLVLAAGVHAAEKDDKDKADNPDRKICKSEAVTGSLMRKRRTCMTQAQWNDLAERSKDAVDRMVYNGSRSTGASINPGLPGS